MKKKIFLMLAGLFVVMFANAQDDNQAANSGKGNNIGAGFSLPLGDFSNTHSFGFSLNYSWSNDRYGKMTAKPLKPVGFTFNVGLDHYFGKSETIGSYNYDYANYSYLHAYGGIMHNPCTNGYLELTGGPVLGLWDGGSEFGFGVNLGGSFGICRSVGINPSFTLMKHSDADPLFVGSLRAHYSF